MKHGADLNDEDSPSILTAVRYCDEKIIRCMVEHGADVNAVNIVDRLFRSFTEKLNKRRCYEIEIASSYGLHL